MTFLQAILPSFHEDDEAFNRQHTDEEEPVTEQEDHIRQTIEAIRRRLRLHAEGLKNGSALIRFHQEEEELHVQEVQEVQEEAPRDRSKTARRPR